MAMSDCPKCWETLCVCGYKYEMLPDHKKREIVLAVAGRDLLNPEIATVDRSALERAISRMKGLPVKHPQQSDDLRKLEEAL